MAQPNGRRSIWLRIPKLFGELSRCVADHWSAGRTAEHLTEISHERVTRNAAIGIANRNGLHFGSQSGHQLPNPRNGIKQVHHKKRHLAATHMPEKPKPIKLQQGPFLGIPLLDLEKHHCRWPQGGDGDGQPITFCGQPKADGSPYCIHHHCHSYYQPRLWASGQSI